MAGRGFQDCYFVYNIFLTWREGWAGEPPRLVQLRPGTPPIPAQSLAPCWSQETSSCDEATSAVMGNNNPSAFPLCGRLLLSPPPGSGRIYPSTV